MDEQIKISRVEVPGDSSIGIGGNVIDSKVEIHIHNPSRASSTLVAPISVSSIPLSVVIWPEPITTHAPDLANRDEEFEFFCSMVADQTVERALFIEAPSNRGKTILLSECKRYLEKVLHPKACVVVDFKATPSKEGAMDTLRLEMKHIIPQLGRVDSSPYDLRAGLRDLQSPLVLFFDTYEKASPDSRETLVLPLINDLEKLPAVRILIAGQQIPDHSNTTWSQWVRHYTLHPITNASKWERVTRKHYPSLNSDHVRALILAAEGEPGTIRAFLQAVNGALSINV